MTEPTDKQIADFKRGWETEHEMIQDQQSRLLAPGRALPRVVPGDRTRAGLRAMLDGGMVVTPLQATWAAQWHDAIVDYGGDVPARETGFAVQMRALGQGRDPHPEDVVVLTRAQADIAHQVIAWVVGGGGNGNRLREDMLAMVLAALR